MIQMRAMVLLEEIGGKVSRITIISVNYLLLADYIRILTFFFFAVSVGSLYY